MFAFYFFTLMFCPHTLLAPVTTQNYNEQWWVCLISILGMRGSHRYSLEILTLVIIIVQYFDPSCFCGWGSDPITFVPWVNLFTPFLLVPLECHAEVLYFLPQLCLSHYRQCMFIQRAYILWQRSHALILEFHLHIPIDFFPTIILKLCFWLTREVWVNSDIHEDWLEVGPFTRPFFKERRVFNHFHRNSQQTKAWKPILQLL